MNKHVIKSPKYFKVPGEDRNIGIEATVDGKPLIIPLDEENTLYEQILKEVKAGTLTIAEAD